jgi:hypothetical protein
MPHKDFRNQGQVLGSFPGPFPGGFIGSYGRDELLNGEIFYTLKEA